MDRPIPLRRINIGNIRAYLANVIDHEIPGGITRYGFNVAVMISPEGYEELSGSTLEPDKEEVFAGHIDRYRKLARAGYSNASISKMTGHRFGMVAEGLRNYRKSLREARP